MKLTKFVLGAGIVTAFALTSCSSDEPLKGGDENISDGTTRYMTVNICDNNLGSRAASDYEDGDAKENKVNKVRFFFFDTKGDAVAVKSGATVNSYDVTIPTPKDPVDPTDPKEEGSEDYNISNVVTCDIIISTEEGDKLPSNIVAVTNYGDWLADNYAKYTDLAKVLLTTEKFANPTNGPIEIANGDFNMCNSVYYDNASQQQFMTPVLAENICHEKKDAREKPVTIYVERTVAKVEGALSDAFNSEVTREGIGDDYEFVVLAKDNDGNKITIDGKDVYIGVNGWSVTGTTQKAQLAKNIGVNWTNYNIMGSNSIAFNEPSLYRSFWETNSWDKVAPSNEDYPLGLQYNSWKDAGKYKIGQAAYVHPNAGTEDNGSRNISSIKELISDYTLTGEYDNARTQVLVKATLLVKNGTAYEPITIANWLGTYYSYNDLLKAMAGYVSHTIYWSFTAPVAGKLPKDETAKSIEVNDLALNTKFQGSSTHDNETRRYPVYAQLNNDPRTKAKYWYDAAGNSLTAAQVNKLLVATEPAKAWTDGATYYYFDIKHLGAPNSAAEYGVVRNHVYKFTIKGITGLGTPVYNPDEIIIPEKPQDQLGYIAATINVLSWRIVSQDVVLGQ